MTQNSALIKRNMEFVWVWILLAIQAHAQCDDILTEGGLATYSRGLSSSETHIDPSTLQKDDMEALIYLQSLALAGFYFGTGEFLQTHNHGVHVMTATCAHAGGPSWTNQDGWSNHHPHKNFVNYSCPVSVTGVFNPALVYLPGKKGTTCDWYTLRDLPEVKN